MKKLATTHKGGCDRIDSNDHPPRVSYTRCSAD